MIKRAFFSLIISQFCFGLLYPEVKPVLAVLDLKSENVTQSDAKIITEYVQDEIFKTGIFELVERTQVEKLLSEYQYQNSGLCDLDCAVSIGRQLAANKVVIGTVGLLGDFYTLHLRIIDVQTNKIEMSDSIKMQCAIGELPDYITALIEKLIPLSSTEFVESKQKSREIDTAHTNLNSNTLDEKFISTHSPNSIEVQLRKAKHQRLWGWVIAIPTAGWSILMIQQISVGNYEPLIISVGTCVLGGAFSFLGVRMITKGNKKIKELQKNGPTAFILPTINPAKRLYGVSVQIVF